MSTCARAGSSRRSRTRRWGEAWSWRARRFVWQGHQPQAQRAPTLGEHSEQIVRELAGWGDAEVAAARSRGALVGPVPAGATARAAAKPQIRYVDSTPPPPRKPLEGVRILDFCWAIAGPLGTRLLADLGAEVIKIESEYRLDPIRYIGVQPPDRFSLNNNGVFNDCSAGKLAVTVNLNTPEGVDTILPARGERRCGDLELHALPARPLGRGLRGAEQDSARHHRLQRCSDGRRGPARGVALLRQRDRLDVRPGAEQRLPGPAADVLRRACTPISPCPTTWRCR